MGAPIKPWLLASAGLGFLIHGANAESLFHLKSSVWGCFDPNVTPAINDATNPQHENAQWIAKTSVEGNCVLITSSSLWKVASADFNGITYITHREAIGIPGSFWVPTAEIDFASPMQSVAAPVKLVPKPIPPAVPVIPPPKVPAASPASDTPPQGLESAARDAGSANLATTNPNSPPSDGSDSGAGILIILVVLVIAWLARRPQRGKAKRTKEAKPMRGSTRSSPKAPASTARSKALAALQKPVPPPEHGLIRIHPSSLIQTPRPSVTSVSPAASATIPNPPASPITKSSQPVSAPPSTLISAGLSPSLTPSQASQEALRPPNPAGPQRASLVSEDPVISPDTSQKFSISVTLAGSGPTSSPSDISPAPPSTTRNTSGIWHPYGETVVVAGVSIADGMVYLGKAGPYVGSYDYSLIDPSLKVAPTSAGAHTVGYWQDYRAFSPACRRRFLEWLASGRQNPGEDIGYVFLFFRGLERRLLADEPSPEEIEKLVSEVIRLRVIYRENRSLDNYCRHLLEAVAFLRDDSVVSSRDFCPDFSELAGEMPPSLRVAIAREVVAGRALGFDLAAAALLSLNEFCAINRFVLEKTRSEFLQMLRPRFKSKFAAGFLLRNRKDSHLRMIYQGAAPGFSVDLAARAKLENLPDPISLTWTKLLELGGAVAEELSPYAKALSYYPARANSLYGLIRCPPELRNTIATEARAWLSDLPSPATVPFSELANHAIGTSTAKWTIRHRRLVSEALAVMGYATEPDPDDGAESLEDDTRVQVFPCANRTRSQFMSNAWKAAMFVALIDGAFDGSSERIAETWLAAMPSRLSLTRDEAIRLRARLAWLATRTITLAKARRSLDDTTQEEREFYAWSATTAAGAVGLVTKSQVAMLEAIYDALTVPRNVLYAGLHAGIGAATTAADEPVLASEGVQETLFPIPPAPVTRQVSEDIDRLSRIRAETERVAAMLKDVFAEDEPPTEEPAAAANTLFAGLDSEHLALLTTLLSRSEWTKTAFENVASAAGLMPGGAMETINEWAFDNFGDAVLEDGDPIVVHQALLQVDAGQIPAE